MHCFTESLLSRRVLRPNFFTSIYVLFSNKIMFLLSKVVGTNLFIQYCLTFWRNSHKCIYRDQCVLVPAHVICLLLCLPSNLVPQDQLLVLFQSYEKFSKFLPSPTPSPLKVPNPKSFSGLTCYAELKTTRLPFIRPACYLCAGIVPSFLQIYHLKNHFDSLEIDIRVRKKGVLEKNIFKKMLFYLFVFFTFDLFSTHVRVHKKLSPSSPGLFSQTRASFNAD